MTFTEFVQTVCRHDALMRDPDVRWCSNVGAFRGQHPNNFSYGYDGTEWYYCSGRSSVVTAPTLEEAIAREARFYDESTR